MDADALYALAPEEFTAARDAAARQRRADGDASGAAALKALRRPSVAAWLVNGLARRSPDLLGSLLELGPELAQAQSGQDGAALRALSAQRRELVEAVTRTALAAAGRPVSAAVRDEVHATLDAGLSDPASAEAIRSGRLVRALSYAGLGEVDLDGAVAPASPPERPARAGRPGPGRRARGQADREQADREQAARRHTEQVAAAEAAARTAAGELDDAVRACASAERARAAAADTAAQRAAEVARMAEELARLERASAAAVEAARTADERATAALQGVEQAQAAAEAARAELDRLRRTGPGA